ncbi:hypothetical protein ADK67_44245 [Saccharothrix sp. NRRL B-16348]|uniref:hypothetical protein n=1 Tax=Saccharothrix sp. NRRL B-16348 TaxID=1415542 RepID=UPI0006AE46C8|nr:hypothetical protein [Saccharothrix sp. NRRL B-16348]KOX13344.1 hypothetical protein ADK67_44245 [Saccharothrix sp. NRRL B-16348]
MTFTAGQKVTAAQLNALETKYAQANKTTNQSMTTTIADLVGCSITITTFVASVVVKITGSMDIENTGIADIGIFQAWAPSTLGGASAALTGDLNVQRTGRDGSSREWVHTLGAAGSYTIKLRGYKIGAANTVQVLATHSRLIVEGAGFTV